MSIWSFVSFLALCQLTLAQKLVFEFHPRHAAGIEGSVTVQYEHANSTRARIIAHLDFAHANQEAIRAVAGNCSHPVTMYEWHLHVQWPHRHVVSGSFAQCSAKATGGHYDPLMACGPKSQYAMTAECKPRLAQYRCRPRLYAAGEWRACEKGDLSGKFGLLQVNPRTKLVHGEWIDPFFPTVGELSPEINLVLHGICNQNDYRIACARVQRVEGDESLDFNGFAT